MRHTVVRAGQRIRSWTAVETSLIVGIHYAARENEKETVFFVVSYLEWAPVERTFEVPVSRVVAVSWTSSCLDREMSATRRNIDSSLKRCHVHEKTFTDVKSYLVSVLLVACSCTVAAVDWAATC